MNKIEITRKAKLVKAELQVTNNFHLLCGKFHGYFLKSVKRLGSPDGKKTQFRKQEQLCKSFLNRAYAKT